LAPCYRANACNARQNRYRRAFAPLAYGPLSAELSLTI